MKRKGAEKTIMFLRIQSNEGKKGREERMCVKEKKKREDGIKRTEWKEEKQMKKEKERRRLCSCVLRE